MSRTEHIKGKMRPLPQAEGETVEDQCKKILERDYPNVELDYPTKYDYKYQLIDEAYEKYVITEYTIYEILEQKDIEDDDGYVTVTDNQDGTYEFDTRFYNGGTCLSEMLEMGLKKMDTNDERTENS